MQRFPIFATIIEANYVKRVTEIENFDISKEKKEIRNLAKPPNIGINCTFHSWTSSYQVGLALAMLQVNIKILFHSFQLSRNVNWQFQNQQA